MGQVTLPLTAESPVTWSTGVASYQTCDQAMAPPFPRLSEFLSHCIYFMMTGCHMVKVLQGIQMLCWNTVSLSFPSPPWLCLSLSLFFTPLYYYPAYSLIYLYVLYRQVMHVLS